MTSLRRVTIRIIEVLLLVLLCGGSMTYALWEGGRDFHTMWHAQTQEYQAAMHEYEQHRCRDTLTTTTNRLILAECQRLGAIIQVPPLSRTLTQLWYRTQELVRRLTLRVAHSYVYKVIVFFTSLAVCYHAFRFYRVAYCHGATGADAFRARMTDDYLFGPWPPRTDYPPDVDWY